MITRTAARRAEDVALDIHRKNFPSHYRVMHWNDIGADTLYKHGIIPHRGYARYARFQRENVPEFGLDGAAIDADDVAHGIQVKQRSGPILDSNHLGTCTWVSLKMLEKDPRSTTHVYCNRPIGYRATDYLPRHFHIHRMENVFDPMDDDADEAVASAETTIVPDLWSHQRDALQALLDYDWETGTLAMPCGSGKTRVMWEFDKYVNGHTVVVSPTRKLASQTLSRVVDKEAPTLLVDTDNTTDIDLIKTFWETNARCVISTTFKSWDAIVRHMETTPDLLMVDEAHSFHASSMGNAKRTLLVSATPNIHEDEETDAKLSAYATAPTLYHMPIADAIGQKIIADYRIYLPILEKGYASDPYARAAFLLDGMYRVTHARRIIVFGSSWDDVDAVLAAIRNMHEKDVETAREEGGPPVIDLWAESYKGTLNLHEREKLEDVFQTFNGIALLGSVDILREGADLPQCDGVYIMDVSNNATRLVQAMMRSMRLSYENKVASVFLWIPERDDVTHVLRLLHEEDPDFTRKLRGLDPRTLQGTVEEQDHWASIEPQWEKLVIDAISVRAVAASEKVLAKAKLLCEEYPMRKSWKYAHDEMFPMEVGGGGKYRFIISTRYAGCRGRIRSEVRNAFLGVDPAFFDCRRRAAKDKDWRDKSVCQKVEWFIQHGASGCEPSRGTCQRSWIDSVRQGRLNLDGAILQRLEDSGIRTVSKKWEKSPETVAWDLKTIDDKVTWLIDYRRKHGRDPPQRTPQGRWINNIRTGRGTKIDAAVAKRMEEGGICTVSCPVERSPNTLMWMKKSTKERVDVLIKYRREKHGDPQQSTSEGTWLRNIRAGKAKIDDANRDRLEAVGIATTTRKRKISETEE